MTSLAETMRADLAQALRERDMTRVKVLRTTLAAIGNAEAVEGVSSVEGVVGYGDVSRRSLTDEDIVGIVAGEVEEWESALAEYSSIGQEQRADGLRRELQILRGYLGDG
jgi:uncharacterized protein YqeY